MRFKEILFDNENFKTAVPSNNYDRPKTTGECGMF